MTEPTRDAKWRRYELSQHTPDLVPAIETRKQAFAAGWNGAVDAAEELWRKSDGDFDFVLWSMRSGRSEG